VSEYRNNPFAGLTQQRSTDIAVAFWTPMSNSVFGSFSQSADGVIGIAPWPNSFLSQLRVTTALPIARATLDSCSLSG
jgi:hypothetical protein